MAIGYTRKDEVTLAWLDNRDTVKSQGSMLLRRVLNEALTELDAQFTAALKAGQVLELDPDKSAIKALLLKVAQKELS